MDKIKKYHSVQKIIYYYLIPLVLVGYLLTKNSSNLTDQYHKIIIASESIPNNKVELENTIKENIKHGFWTTDLNILNEKITDLPWINSVNIRRQWPGQLTIELDYEKPIAIWNNRFLLSENYSVWTKASWDKTDTSINIDKLPKLTGPIEHLDEIIEKFSEFNPLFLKLSLGIDSLILSKRGAWKLQLSNGTNIELGRNNIVKKTQRVIAFYKRHLINNEDKVENIDLRYSNGLAIRWKKAADDKNNSRSLAANNSKK